MDVIQAVEDNNLRYKNKICVGLEIMKSTTHDKFEHIDNLCTCSTYGADNRDVEKLCDINYLTEQLRKMINDRKEAPDIKLKFYDSIEACLDLSIGLRLAHLEDFFNKWMVERHWPKVTMKDNKIIKVHYSSTNKCCLDKCTCLEKMLYEVNKNNIFNLADNQVLIWDTIYTFPKNIIEEIIRLRKESRMKMTNVFFEEMFYDQIITIQRTWRHYNFRKNLKIARDYGFLNDKPGSKISQLSEDLYRKATTKV